MSSKGDDDQRPGYVASQRSRRRSQAHESSYRKTASDGPARNYSGGRNSSSTVSPQSQSMAQQRHIIRRNEFDGPTQLLEPSDDRNCEPKEEDLPQLPVTLSEHEQDNILARANDALSQCAFDFVARYQFPVPIEPNKRLIRIPSDREWTEWVYLLKRLATKRRIPARVLYQGQVKQLITILENSSEIRDAAIQQSRPLRDDKNVLQLISSGIQVAKVLKDAPAMRFLDGLYVETEGLIQGRTGASATPFPTTQMI